MSEQAQEFSGVLGRATVSADSAELRFYPWSFRLEPGATPVLLVRFAKPDFQTEDTAPLVDEGVEVSIFGDRAEVWRECDHGEFVLRAASVATKWIAYDIDDLADRVRQLEAAWSGLHSDLSGARRKIDDAAKLAHELIRRAEAKAQLSPEMRVRQEEAVRVLERIAGVLEEKKT